MVLPCIPSFKIPPRLYQGYDVTNMVIELFGLPGSGKSTLARSLESSAEASRVRIESRSELLLLSLLFFVRHPIRSALLLSYIIRYAGSPSLFYTKFVNLFLEHTAKYEKARAQKNTVVIDQGHFQNLLSLFEHPMSEAILSRYAQILPKPDELWVCVVSEEERQRRIAERGYGGANEVRSPRAVMENMKTAEKVVRSLPGLTVRTVGS